MKVYEGETNFGKIRIVESAYNFDGITDKAWRLYNIYETDGRVVVRESIANESYAKDIIKKYDLKLVRG